jgi:hypothetical protein
MGPFKFFWRGACFKILLLRTFFQLRSEYILSRYLFSDVQLCFQDVSVLDLLGFRFAVVFALPVVEFYKRFRSARFRTFLKVLFSGFFFVDFDLIIRQLAYGFRRSRRRQYPYVYKILPALIRFSNYYNTLIRGFRFLLRGKLGGRLRTRIFILEDFKPLTGLFLQSFCSGIQYRFTDVHTYTGTFGIHIFVYLEQRYVANLRTLES